VSNGQWWRAYVQPLPTWETLEGYGPSLGLLSLKSPSVKLLEEGVRGYLAGLLEGESYFCYTHYASGRYPCVYIRMCELKPIQYFSHIMNVSITSVQRAYVSQVKGLRAILLTRMIRPLLTGKRRLVAELFDSRGYKILSQQTLEEYSRVYKNPYRRTNLPSVPILFE
jgi:hypothetical protein